MGLTRLILILSLSLLVSDITLTLADDFLIDLLYNSVNVGAYTMAVAQTRDLEKFEKTDVIEDVVTRLLTDGKRNLIEYVYQLWKQGLQKTVRNHFPVEFRLIVDGTFVKLVNRRDDLALMLAGTPDNDGDRLSYSDGNDKISHRVSWKMIPMWDNDRVYFQIYNTYRMQYLKLQVDSDSDGDHKAFGSEENDTYRHLWYLHPVKYKDDVLFYIFNREYNQALKLSSQADSIGDRLLWSHNGTALGNPEKFGWFVLPFQN